VAGDVEGFSAEEAGGGLTITRAGEEVEAGLGRLEAYQSVGVRDEFLLGFRGRIKFQLHSGERFAAKINTGFTGGACRDDVEVQTGLAGAGSGRVPPGIEVGFTCGFLRVAGFAHDGEASFDLRHFVRSRANEEKVIALFLRFEGLHLAIENRAGFLGGGVSGYVGSRGFGFRSLGRSPGKWQCEGIQRSGGLLKFVAVFRKTHDELSRRRVFDPYFMGRGSVSEDDRRNMAHDGFFRVGRPSSGCLFLAGDCFAKKMSTEETFSANLARLAFPLMNIRLLALAFLALCSTRAIAQSVVAASRAPHVFFLIGEAEYDTKTTVPAFARAELEPRGVRCTFSLLPSEESNEFPNIEALKDADLLFVSVRRHTPPAAQMAAIRAYVAAGKPVVGIRTASHAFALRGKPGQPAQVPEGFAAWPEFDHDVLGGNYSDHYGHGIETFGKIVPAQAQHPVLQGIGAEEFAVPSHLYKNPNLPAWVTPLVTGRMTGRPEVEPLAWVNTKDGRRVFYTSLGAPEDFAIPQFRQLLLNGVFWALDRPKTAVKPAVSGK
jgi:type 1 glutamine amidotransferase